MSQRKPIANDLELEVYFPEPNAVLPDRPVPTLPGSWSSLVCAFIAQARSTPSKLLVKDKLGTVVTYDEGLKRSVALAQVIKRHAGKSNFVGVMLPPSAAGVLANLAVPMTGRGVINVNYLLSEDIANAAIRNSGTKLVVTSRALIEKTGFKLDAEILYIEDCKDQVTSLDKARIGLALAMPLSMLRLTGGFGAISGASQSLDDTATVMFTTGSTGDPKGAVLSHGNILFNVAQVLEHTGIERNEVFLGILPYFHSYGFMATLWAVAVTGMSVVCHHNALEIKEVGEIMEENNVTVMAGTPTLMRNYLRKLTRAPFEKIKLLLLGSEKMLPSLAADIEEKLGVKAVEGMGATECSPVISGGVNKMVPSPRGGMVWGNREGSVGQAVPGTALCILDMETGAIMPRGKANVGLLLVGGPQNMKGYLNNPGKTAGILQNGWYFTGDMASVDEDGFLYILDRADEVAKVGPEKVPLILVKMAIIAVSGVDETAVHVKKAPDASKGEKLVVLHTCELDARAVIDKLGRLGEPENAEAFEKLGRRTLHNLWIPKARDFYRVEAFPIAASGKTDLKAVRKMAIELDAASKSKKSSE